MSVEAALQEADLGTVATEASAVHGRRWKRARIESKVASVRLLANAAGAVVVLLIALMLAIMSPNRALALPSASANSQEIMTPPDYLLPGQPFPNTAQCTWPAYIQESLSCWVTLDNSPIFLSYNLRTKQITRTSIPVNHETVGHLMLNWGVPTGITVYEWAIEVDWDERSIFVAREAFSPNSTTGYLSYSDNSEKTASGGQDVWHGFTFRDK